MLSRRGGEQHILCSTVLPARAAVDRNKTKRGGIPVDFEGELKETRMVSFLDESQMSLLIYDLCNLRKLMHYFQTTQTIHAGHEPCTGIGEKVVKR